MEATSQVRNEAGLLARFAAGDLDAFETIFREHQAEVFGWILRIVRQRTRPSRRSGAFTAPARTSMQRVDLGAWARRIATNAAVDALKGAAREVAGLADPPAAPAPTPDPGLESAVRGAFHRLPAKLQAAASLALIEELPNADIAAALGISVPAVKSRVSRAVGLLRKKLRRLGIESA